MYELINKEESKRYRCYCSNILNKVISDLRDKGITAQFVLVGSGAKNLITRNGNGPYDLDYNLFIIKMDKKYNNLHYLKDTVRIALNDACEVTDFSDAQDSTSVLTSLFHFHDEPQVKFSFDVAIIKKNPNGHDLRLIHNKNSNSKNNEQYTWNEVPSSHNVCDKAEKIKKAGQWEKVRICYIEKKNFYIGDDNHPSYVIYVEAVNEIYAKLSNKNLNRKSDTIQCNPNTAASSFICDKTAFNCTIQQILSKTKQYDNKTISKVAKLSCENYSGKKNKKVIHNELSQKFGNKIGNDIYTRISSKLK